VVPAQISGDQHATPARPWATSSSVRASPSSALLVRAEIVVLVLAIVSGLATWGVGIPTRGYDYDEVMRAHSAWLAAQGLRTYRDFLDCHPPYFPILAPVIRLYANDPCAALWSLRILSATGNLLFLGGLAALGASLAPSERRWGLLGLVLVACQPAVLEHLVEFRIDGWGYALTAWSIYRFRLLARGVYRHFELGLATGIASLLFCPKLALLAPLIVLSERLLARETARRNVMAVIAYASGTLCALGLFAIYLSWQEIDFDRTLEILIGYNAISNKNLGIRDGLLRSIVTQRFLVFLIGAGVLGWAALHWRHRLRPEPIMTALAVWLVLQVFVVAYPYKQYYAPWFLLASGFVVYLYRTLADLLGPARLFGLLAAFAVTAVGDLRTGSRWIETGTAMSDQKTIRWMNRVSRRDDRVVGSPPTHPIDRFDSFFLWFNTFAPGGFDAERILAQLPAFKRHVIAGRFREELEANPPALVVLSGDWRIVPYTAGQREALSAFLRERGYLAVHFGTTWFGLRPDRFEQAQRDGLLELSAGR
jgi:hypothetical protein